jgi:hypothetical protein
MPQLSLGRGLLVLGRVCPEGPDGLGPGSCCPVGALLT